MTKESLRGKCVAGLSLHGGLERPLCEVVKVKPGLSWRPQDVGDARDVGH